MKRRYLLSQDLTNVVVVAPRLQSTTTTKKRVRRNGRSPLDSNTRHALTGHKGSSFCLEACLLPILSSRTYFRGTGVDAWEGCACIAGLLAGLLSGLLLR